MLTPTVSLLLFGLDVPNLPRSRQNMDQELKFIELDFLGSSASQATCQELLNGQRASPEIVTTLLSLCLLDLPFLILRITLMVAYGFYTSSGLFFILKNVMMCFLQVGPPLRVLKFLLREQSLALICGFFLRRSNFLNLSLELSQQKFNSKSITLTVEPTF